VRREVDKLINRVLDDDQGCLAYKLGLVRKAVGGMEIDPCLEDLVVRLLEFLRRDSKT